MLYNVICNVLSMPHSDYRFHCQMLFEYKRKHFKYIVDISANPLCCICHIRHINIIKVGEVEKNSSKFGCSLMLPEMTKRIRTVTPIIRRTVWNRYWKLNMHQ